MSEIKHLISISTYKESENIESLIKLIRQYDKDTKILLINDFSGDHTTEIVNKIKDKNIEIIERKKKLGLGTAHLLSIFYAIKFNYDFLLTMDADFSHDPKHIPSLFELSKKNSFVIGSRYCQGGKTEYKGFRKIVSILGNYVARKILKINLKEITTYFRVYDVRLLKKLPFDELKASGYSLGVKIVWFMKVMGAELIETPIHFRDRNKGKSKIPKMQIFISGLDLILIKFDELIKKRSFNNNNTYKFDQKCKHCKYSFFSKFKKNIYRCLVCLKKEKFISK
tara:strand:- start:158 stop:1003 length:846 start_codon:yes stop_codon:yes gene_type:complete